MVGIRHAAMTCRETGVPVLVTVHTRRHLVWVCGLSQPYQVMICGKESTAKKAASERATAEKTAAEKSTARKTEAKKAAAAKAAETGVPVPVTIQTRGIWLGCVAYRRIRSSS